VYPEVEAMLASRSQRMRSSDGGRVAARLEELSEIARLPGGGASRLA
jgi:hypothetical protein